MQQPQRQKSFHAVSVVLRGTPVGETDRAITVLSKEYGKFTCIAKGVRTFSSSKRAFLEPGSIIGGHFVATKSLPLLTQAKLLKSFAFLDQPLTKLRSLFQVLEIIDSLFAIEQPEPELFVSVVRILDELRVESRRSVIRDELSDIVSQLGYASLSEAGHTSLHAYVSELTEKPLNSWKYLTPHTHKQS